MAKNYIKIFEPRRQEPLTAREARIPPTPRAQEIVVFDDAMPMRELQMLIIDCVERAKMNGWRVAVWRALAGWPEIRAICSEAAASTTASMGDDDEYN